MIILMQENTYLDMRCIKKNKKNKLKKDITERDEAGIKSKVEKKKGYIKTTSVYINSSSIECGVVVNDYR